MTTRTLDLRWLVGGLIAAVVAVAGFVASLLMTPGTAREQVVNGVGWLFAITAVVCLVRAGFDAGVRKGPMPTR